MVMGFIYQTLKFHIHNQSILVAVLNNGTSAAVLQHKKRIIYTSIANV
jgi:hypothetical protein